MKLLTGYKGLLRTIAALLTVASQLPALLPYSEVLIQIAAFIGGLGVVRAAAGAMADK